MTLAMWIFLFLLENVIVAVAAFAYGKAHPTVQSAIVDEAGKIAKKIGG